MAIHLLPKSASSRSTSRPRAGRGATASCCRSRQNTALFSLLGTTYGGNGKSNFALPDLQGRAPMHPGQGPGLSLHDLGETGGCETVTLLESEIPAAHARGASASSGRTEPRRPRRARSCATGVGIGQYAAPGAPDPAQPECAGPGRRRSAAQQHAALPDLLLLHRPAGRVPAARAEPIAHGRAQLSGYLQCPRAARCYRSCDRITAE